MRIIAGKFRGRRLTAPPGLETRPTTDRVREAWFSMLGPLEGAVLDLYAGTGALGFEALSRGATKAVFIECAKPACLAIDKNATTLGLTAQVVLLRSTLESSVSALVRQGPYDLILSDPPWTSMESCLQTLRSLPWTSLLKPGGRLVFGHPKRLPVDLPEDSGLTLIKARSWGDSAAVFFERAVP